MSFLRVPDLILKKRNGGELTQDEIDFFIKAICNNSNNNSIQESQIGAMLMAIYFRGMNYEESFRITKSMINSGVKFSWPNFKNSVVDKHSTGGVGDKISLPLAPALAACGLKIPMISGRGLGFTGGTLDKLESIPGLCVSFPKETIDRLVSQVGLCIVGQTIEINPADRILYATRDITSTVDCIPLIAGSIVSKKAIEDLDALVLDIKIGKAALLSDPKEAEQLSEYMLQICRRLGVKAGVFLTKHDNPLGRTIGNQTEIEETIECLYGNIPADLEELITKFGGYLLQRTKRVNTMVEGAKIILEKLKNGEALKKFKEMIIAQGVSKEIADELCDKRNYDKVFPVKSKYVSLIKARHSGYIKSINALELGVTCNQLGAGRSKAGDSISYEVGYKLLKTVGDRVQADEPWLKAYHNFADFDAVFAPRISSSLELSTEPVKNESLIHKILDFD